MESEVWKPVVGFEEKYMVSNFGRVRTVERDVITPHGGIKHIPQHILTLQLDSYGYYRINLMTKKNTRKKCTVHRLVAEAFIPNPNNYPIINHKDETRTNNHVSNLEWCDYQYNNTYGTVLERRAKKMQKKVEMIDRKTGEILRTFNSIKEAAEYVGINHTCISDVCLHKPQKYSAGGYVWRYADENVRANKGVSNEIRLPKTIIYFGRKIEMINKDTGEVLRVFKNLKEAGDITGIDTSLICSVCRGGYGCKSAGGYKWCYADKTN